MKPVTDPFSFASLIGTSIVFMVIILAFAVGLATLLSVYEKKKLTKEKRELKEEIDNYLGLIQEEPGDVLAVITRNLALLREAYIISKQQVRDVFSAAIFTCCLGFIIFATGVIAFSSQRSGMILVCSTIAGAVIELIAGLIFWIYNQSIEQLNSFHKTFYENQKLLSSIHLVNNVSEMNKDALYAYIIQTTIGSGSATDFSFLINSAKSSKTNF
ncbi:MAG TPA: hypothetical protein V6D11_15335 [Waterburya sp.]|jgi:hypothetical protein